MLAPQGHVLAAHDGRYASVFRHAQHAVRPQETTVFHHALTREPAAAPLYIRGHGAGDLVFIAQHGFSVRLLVQEDIALGVDVFLHILVVVQMVGRDVRHHRHLRGLAHADKLEAGKLHHGYIRGRDGVHHRQQRAAQVAAQMHGVPRRLQYFAMSVVVVVLPSEPVTATILQGQSRKNSSISLVTSAPASRAATSSGV